MTYSRSSYISKAMAACITVSFLILGAVTARDAQAQGVGWPTQNVSTGHNNNLPPYNYIPGTGTQGTRSTRSRGSNCAPGIYPGLPVSSLTYVQPNCGGGYTIGTYGNGYGAPSVYGWSGAPGGYVVVDEGAVQNILPVSPSMGYAGGYAADAPAPQNNVYNYTVNNYYTTPATSAAPQDASPAPASANPANVSPGVQGYDLALGDIQQAWSTGDFTLIKKYLPSDTGTIKISAGGQAPGTIGPAQFTAMTQTVFAKLTTYSFVITAVHQQSDGSVTGYVTHTYSPAGQSDGRRSTIYWAFTLVDANGGWIISEIDSSMSPFTPTSKSGSSAAASLLPAAALVAAS